MMKQKGNIPIFLIIIILAAGAAVYFFVKSNMPTFQNLYPSPAPSPTNIVALKTFQSRTMKFMIQVPDAFELKDNITDVDLKTPLGKITIVKNGTNFNNLRTYIADFDSKRKLEVNENKWETINDNEALSRLVHFIDSDVKQKSYYIYSNYNVFIISTTSESLYSDLNQIAQSFRYIP